MAILYTSKQHIISSMNIKSTNGILVGLDSGSGLSSGSDVGDMGYVDMIEIVSRTNVQPRRAATFRAVYITESTSFMVICDANEMFCCVVP